MPQLDPTANFNGPFRFFDLPHELRSMVYHEIWLHKSQFSQRGLLGPKLLYRCITAYYQEQPHRFFTGAYHWTWFIVSERFLAEAIEHFYRKIRFEAQVPGSYLTTPFYFGSPLVFKGQRSFIRDCLIDALSDIKYWRPRDIPKSDFSKTAVEVLKTRPMTTAPFNKMETALLGKDRCKTLTIIFGVFLDRIGKELTVDLSAFERPGSRLDKIVVQVVWMGENT